ncbi:LacI family DNA-binding transcriptional regulator [Bifidobacterium thermacidophilum]|uniref:LacI-type transcriptional regulator n=1 Tax=Bifidobacterium thermacidophilum subsp. thermacidophilum TaxID=79262 RepID=A0A087E371_9BIFI|nr:LacI family DNA-binding transcriptional regulator [Bifidobacterium thermacidophilum]KFJ02222.1 LacI-type transcriptional regulator [Bifidobacterium thermacidophilum subsp. thermacidophilum]
MATGQQANKRPSMFEVARLAGVSHQTVSRVINDFPGVSPATRAKVQRAIEQLDYRPSNPARALASRKSRTIGLIAGGREFYGPISSIGAIESIARSHSMFMSVLLVHEATCTQKEFDDLCRILDEQNVDAFIFLTPTDVMFSAACRAQVIWPRVLLTSTHGGMGLEEELRLLRPSDRRKIALAGIDQWSAMKDVMGLLKTLGHRSALYFAGPREWRDAATRLAAWNDLCAADAMNSVTIQCDSWDGSEAYARMNHVLEDIGRSGGKLPTAVVASNDAQAMAVARALHEHGMRIPQDVSVVGFDDMPGVDNMYPPLTTVRQDFEMLGQQAMREVLFLLGEGDKPQYASVQHGVGMVPAKLIRRSSVGVAPNR